MDYSRRITGLQDAMEQLGIDLVIYGACPNYQYLTGVAINWRGAPDLQPIGDLLLIPREGEPILIYSGAYPTEDCSIVRKHRFDPSVGANGMLRSLIKELSLDVRKLGLGAYLPTEVVMAAVSASGRPELFDASQLMDHLRAIKEPEEIDRLRSVAKLTDDVMATVIGRIREGVSQRDLMFEMRSEALRRGASDVSFGPWACFVKSGSADTQQSLGSRVTSYRIDQGLVRNTAITFDVGFVMNGYCSDWGRSVYWGTPPDDVRNAYASLCESMVRTVADMSDGSMRACDVYPAIEKHLDALGFGEQMRARLGTIRIMGHQIGTEVHENPWLKPEQTEPLRAGMVLCIEPKLWMPGEYYLRLEEMVHITDTGAEFLTTFDRALFEL